MHACAHALGAVCDLHHGLANALMIDTVLDWNREAVPEKFAELSHAADVEPDGDGAAFVRWLRALKAQIGIDRWLGRARRHARPSAAIGRHWPRRISPR